MRDTIGYDYHGNNLIRAMGSKIAIGFIHNQERYFFNCSRSNENMNGFANHKTNSSFNPVNE